MYLRERKGADVEVNTPHVDRHKDHPGCLRSGSLPKVPYVSVIRPANSK